MRILWAHFSIPPQISRFFRVIKKLRPTFHAPVPTWDLFIILKHLPLSPFEPLQDFSLKLLSNKTFFLLVITFARRIRELHDLSCKSHTWDLRTMLVFFNRVSSNTNLNQEIVLLDLSQDSIFDSSSLHLLYIKRSLLTYLERTQLFRSSETLSTSFHPY